MFKLFRVFYLYPFIIGWFAIFAWCGIDSFTGAPQQIAKDGIFIATQIKPHIKTIDSFKVVNHRLPSVAEFHKIKHGNSPDLGNEDYIREEVFVDKDIKGAVKNMDWTNNYVLSVWRGEWAEYYISDGNKYITNNYSLADGSIGALVCFVIAVIPAAIFAMYKRRKYVKLKKLIPRCS